MDNITTKKGPKPGPTIAIFGGIHGNERAGILTVDRLARELEPIAGTVHLVYANPPAIGANVRLVAKNMNRIFVRGRQKTDCFEDKRADELMDLLDTCDALLDLHSYPSPYEPEESIPFAICEPPSHGIAALFDAPIVVSGFDALEKGGTDGYMHANGKPGICVELGAIERPGPFLALGMRVATAFLAHFGCIEAAAPAPSRPQRHLRVSVFHKKSSENFVLARKFHTFDRIAAGETIATEGGKPIVAERESFIIFPASDRPVGIEAFLLAEEDALTSLPSRVSPR
jgi:succinylglutamate desuccinylase